MAHEKQAGQFAYDDEDFDHLEFEHDRPSGEFPPASDEAKKKHENLCDLAKGDFTRLVDVLKEMQPGMTGCEALAKARRLAPNTVAKMNGEPGGPASYNTKEECLVTLAKNEFHYTVDQISKRDKCDRATAMYKVRRGP